MGRRKKVVIQWVCPKCAANSPAENWKKLPRGQIKCPLCDAPVKRKTLVFSEWQRLTVCNSLKLPEYVEVSGRRHHYVGIGWIDVGRADGTEVLIIDD